MNNPEDHSEAEAAETSAVEDAISADETETEEAATDQDATSSESSRFQHVFAFFSFVISQDTLCPILLGLLHTYRNSMQLDLFPNIRIYHQ